MLLVRGREGGSLLVATNWEGRSFEVIRSSHGPYQSSLKLVQHTLRACEAH